MVSPLDTRRSGENSHPSDFAAGGHFLLFATLFSTARRSNGYAALHDLATGRRVVERRARGPRRSRRRSAALSEPARGRDARAVRRRRRHHRRSARLAARRRQRLRRPVWIRDLAGGTTPPAPRRAALARPTRLRWLAGRRTAGRRGTSTRASPACRWPRRAHAPVVVRGAPLAADLAHELAAQRPTTGRRSTSIASGSWNRAGPSCSTTRPRRLARRTRSRGRACWSTWRGWRGERARPWPLAAERFRGRLAAPPSVEIAASVTELEELSRRPVAAARSRRALSMATQMACPVLPTAMMVGGMLFVINLMGRISPDERATMDALYELSRAERGRSTLSAEDRQALEGVALAARYRLTLSNPRFNQQRMPLLTPKHKAIADAILPGGSRARHEERRGRASPPGGARDDPRAACYAGRCVAVRRPAGMLRRFLGRGLWRPGYGARLPRQRAAAAGLRDCDGLRPPRVSRSGVGPHRHRVVADPRSVDRLDRQPRPPGGLPFTG